MIDVNSGEEKLHINLDITLSKAPCSILSLDIVDVTGVHVVDIEGKLHKYRIDKYGKELGMLTHIDESGHAEIDTKVHGTEEHTNSVKGMTEIERVYRKALDEIKNEEGCKMSGFVYINKVPGNFHISGHHYP